MQRWSDIQFAVEFTGDGSPSLRLPQGESMHHSGGAAEETELIYGKVIHRCFEVIPQPHFMSVGLGLGYVELTVAREALLRQNLNFTLESFELIPELKEWFMLWLQGKSLSPEVCEVYDQVLKYILQASAIEPGKFKNFLWEKYQSQDFILQGPLHPYSEFKAKAHCLLFDAFSAKTSPDLWTEEFLVELFNKATAPHSLVSTYASRTALKKALKTAGFLVQVREGFKGKRNSTLASKGF
ncbi:MAG: MnmC family methyltransferase [Pseudobdellovibrionaceae bacterium]